MSPKKKRSRSTPKESKGAYPRSIDSTPLAASSPPMLIEHRRLIFIAFLFSILFNEPVSRHKNSTSRSTKKSSINMNKPVEYKNVIICREKLSPFWIAQWTDGRGKRICRSTKVPVGGGSFQGERLSSAQAQCRALMILSVHILSALLIYTDSSAGYLLRLIPLFLILMLTQLFIY